MNKYFEIRFVSEQNRVQKRLEFIASQTDLLMHFEPKGAGYPHKPRTLNHVCMYVSIYLSIHLPINQSSIYPSTKYITCGTRGWQ